MSFVQPLGSATDAGAMAFHIRTGILVDCVRTLLCTCPCFSFQNRSAGRSGTQGTRYPAYYTACFIQIDAGHLMAEPSQSGRTRSNTACGMPDSVAHVTGTTTISSTTLVDGTLCIIDLHQMTLPLRSQCSSLMSQQSGLSKSGRSSGSQRGHGVSQAVNCLDSSSFRTHELPAFPSRLSVSAN